MKKIYFVYLIVLGFCLSLNAQNISKKDKQLGIKLDSILTKEFKPNEPGCAVLVSRKGQIVYKKAFGMANLELNVPINPEMVFELASITKQFTGIAIMQLVEHGKISLQDPIDKFIPDFPTHGNTITIEHLLTNTSGIKDFMELKEFDDISFARKDFTPSEFVNFFKNKNENLDFAPGTKSNYSNTGYFMLGYIIEKVSGMSYEKYIDENIFKPAGMSNSYYNDYTRIIKNRVKCYDRIDNEFKNAEYLSPKICYSAGALMCTVDDFYKYYQALNSYKLVSKESLEKTRTSYKLQDGTDVGYGYGLQVRNLHGYQTIDHGGGGSGNWSIHWFFPTEDVHFVIFTNCGEYMKKDSLVWELAVLSLEK